MYVRRNLLVAAIVIEVCAGLLPKTVWAADETVLTLKAGSGAKLRSLLTGDPGLASANLILLTGGKGVLKISGKGQIKKPSHNFLVRARHRFARAGFLTALVDAPMDRRKKPGLLGGFRASTAHGKDLGRVVRALHGLNGKPVIVIGTSRGTVSALNVAVRDTSGFLKAVVLTSAITKANRRGKSIGDLPLGKIRTPLLFLHNKGDKCKTTPLSGVSKVVRRLGKKGIKPDMIVVRSSKKSGRHCGGKSPHGFLGIEAQVVEKIIGWIKALQ